MLVVGIVLLLARARAYVDYSLAGLFAVPALGLLAGMLVAHGASFIPWVEGSDWRTAGMKAGVLALVYAAAEFIFEREQLVRMYLVFTSLLRVRASKAAGSGNG
jgi:hypothetical protein